MTVREETQKLIARELELNGIHLDETAWLASADVLDEFAYILTPERHESRIPSYGAIFTDSTESLGKLRKLPIAPGQLDLARRLANGVHSFLVYEKAQVSSLVFFPEPRATELELVRMVPPSGGMIVQRDSDGVTKFFRHSGIVSHLNRTWSEKPHVQEALRRIAACVPGINRSVLNRILEFAFHLLSPASRIGATLVWHLDPVVGELEAMKLSLLDERDSSAICHLLSQVDGATFLAPGGELVQTGVHLKFSQKAAAIIPEFKGTRHTSARRFSYDHGETIVITISEDGPVTVFSDGASIADLRARSGEQEVRLLRNIAPEKKEDIGDRSFVVACKKCGKSAMVDEITVLGCRELRSVSCPVCSEPIYSSECFTLSCNPYKPNSRSFR